MPTASAALARSACPRAAAAASQPRFRRGPAPAGRAEAPNGLNAAKVRLCVGILGRLLVSFEYFPTFFLIVIHLIDLIYYLFAMFSHVCDPRAWLFRGGHEAQFKRPVRARFKGKPTCLTVMREWKHLLFLPLSMFRS
jgi:hypothetical protein